MAKSKTFICSACGATSTKWSGRCEACGEWNTIHEETPLSAGPASKSLGAKRGSSIPLTSLATEETPPPRTHSGIEELDRVTGLSQRGRDVGQAKGWHGEARVGPVAAGRSGEEHTHQASALTTRRDHPWESWL